MCWSKLMGLDRVCGVSILVKESALLDKEKEIKKMKMGDTTRKKQRGEE